MSGEKVFVCVCAYGRVESRTVHFKIACCLVLLVLASVYKDVNSGQLVY